MTLDFRYLGITDNPVTLTDYQQAWDLQREIHRQVSQGELGGTVLYLEHPPTYTAGRRTEPHERPVDGTPVIDVDRGGKITWHGPGQLVGYPIVRIPDDGVGVVDYIRRIEEAVIRCLAEYGLTTGRVKGRSGVWLSATATKPERKVCAIGIRVAHKTTMHGFALTVSSDLGDFGKIVPCGIDDAGVTSLADELDNPPTVAEVAKALEPHLETLLSWEDYEKSPDLHPEPTEVSYGLQLQS